MGRPFWVIAHRWAGLTLALFLGVAGFTGIFLSWIDELEVAAAPGLQLAAPPSPGAAPLSTLELRRLVLARYPGARIDYVPLAVEPGRSLRLYLTWPDPKTGLPRADAPAWDDLFIDPYTGAELGRRQWGNIAQGARNLMPFLYRLHYSLALGQWGLLAFGVAALVWGADCFVGFYLTLPVATKVPAKQGWLARWAPAWMVRRGASRYKLNFDLHRAGGLWIWPVLLVFAVSSVSFNLPQVYGPVMRALGAQDREAIYQSTLLPAPRWKPALDMDQAVERGKILARQEMVRAGLALQNRGETYIWYIPATGAYVYGFTSGADISRHGAGTFVGFDGNSGALRAVHIPTGRHGADTFTTWIEAIHTAHVGGTAWRIATSLIGAMVTMLCITGVVIWMKKRSGRLSRRTRALTAPDKAAATGRSAARQGPVHP